MPQNFAHLNRKVPAFDGVNLTVADWSFENTTFSRPRSLDTKPCFVSVLRNVISTGSPTLTSIREGSNAYL